GVLPLLRQRAHYMQIAYGVTSMAIELEVIRGTVAVAILPSDGLLRHYYEQAFPEYGRQFTRGKYAIALPAPSAGTWTLSVNNISATSERNPTLVSTGDAEYAITVRLLRGSLDAGRVAGDTVSLDFRNRASALREPVLETSTATVVSHRA